MRGGNFIRTAAAVALALAALLPQVLHAQQQQPPSPPPQTRAVRLGVDLGEFTKEIMALRIEGGQQHLVMWLPYEFFVAAGMSEPGVSREAIERELAFLKPYITVFVMSSVERPDGKEAYATEAEARKRAAVRLADGTQLLPLEVVPPKVAALLSAMKAFMAAQGGADRESLHALVFPASTSAGKPVVDTSKKDSMTVVLKADARFREAAFTWRTPFDAMSPAADCPRCKAGISAKWTYCPYCGQKLTH